MDDFGSGYSSLNMLSSIPIDILKLDMRFLQSQNDVSKASNIIEFIIKLGQWLQIPVVAEGIETSADVSFLKRIGCKYGQGYYFAKPMPVEQFEQLLSNDTIYVETVAN
jgi:EAL domain-containing protein (putative c-di-GMP-specific phosphodiesterase class I)